MEEFVAFLRGINVGGRKKVPMADLKKMMVDMGNKKVGTLLNSGNVIFSAPSENTNDLENQLESAIEKHFGFPVPVIVRRMNDIKGMVKRDPFEDVKIHDKIRLYVTFIKDLGESANLEIPWENEDGSFIILEVQDRIVYSVLDLTVSGTPKAMEQLDKTYGKKNITTRNWKTILKIEKKSVH